jgi:hypothetical protein
MPLRPSLLIPDPLRFAVTSAVSAIAAYFWIAATLQERISFGAAIALLGSFIVITARTIPFGRYSGLRSHGEAAETLRRLPPDPGDQRFSLIGYGLFVSSVLAAGAFFLLGYPAGWVGVARGVGAIIVLSLLLIAARSWVGYRMRTPR